MNPRHRRLVIPVALAGVLLVVVSRRCCDERAPRRRARPGHRPDPRPRAARARHRLGPPPRRAAAVAARGAALRRPPRRPGAPGDGVRRQRRRTRPTTRRATRRPGALASLLAEPFGNWHVDTATETHQLRVTKKGDAVVHSAPRAAPVEADRPHDREKARLLPGGRPRLRGSRPGRPARPDQAEQAGEVPPGRGVPPHPRRRPHRRHGAGHLRTPTEEDPLRVVDLGCGNAYLTLAANRYLTAVRGLPVRLVGVDRRAQPRWSDPQVVEAVGCETEFVEGTILDAVVEPTPEVVLALHACDTATDEALARAVGWGAPLVLAAPCCHHDLAAQLRRYAAAVAVLAADPARHPARAVRRHADRRGAGGAAADAGLSRRGRCSSSRASTRRATPCSARRAPGRPDVGVGEEYAALVAAVGRPAASGRPARRARAPDGCVASSCWRAAGGPVRHRDGGRVQPGDRGDDEVLASRTRAIVESSGLVALGDGSSSTTNDSGDSGRVFTVDGDGETVGVTTWAATTPTTSRRWPPQDRWRGLGRRHRRQPGVSATSISVAAGARRRRRPGRRAADVRRWSIPTARATPRRCWPTR